jgi:hypothetical protein
MMQRCFQYWPVAYSSQSTAILCFQNGRHALQEIMVNPFIPNDAAVSD